MKTRTIIISALVLILLAGTVYAVSNYGRNASIEGLGAGSGAVVYVVDATGLLGQDVGNLSYYPGNQTLVVKLVKTQNISDSDNSSYYIDPAATGASAVFAGKIISGTTTSRTPQLFIVSGDINSQFAADGVVEIQATSNRPDLTGSGTLVVESNSAMAVDKGSSISFGGRTNASSTQGDIFGAIFGGKQSGVDTERNGYLAFFTNAANSYVERMRLASNGSLALGTTTFASVAPVFVMAQAGSVPTGFAAGTGGMVVVGGEVYLCDSTSNCPIQTPHPNDFLNNLSLDYYYPWVYESTNPYLGRKITVDEEGAFRALEALTGKQFIYTEEIPKLSWADLENWREQTENSNNKGRAVDAWLRNATEFEISPPEAFEMTWDNKTITTGKIIDYRTEYSYDETGAVTASVVPVYETKTISKQKKQLKNDVRFDKAVGKFYRKPTKAEAEVAVGEGYPHYTKQSPPKWMAARGAN